MHTSTLHSLHPLLQRCIFQRRNVATATLELGQRVPRMEAPGSCVVSCSPAGIALCSGCPQLDWNGRASSASANKEPGMDTEAKLRPSPAGRSRYSGSHAAARAASILRRKRSSDHVLFKCLYVFVPMVGYRGRRN